MEEKIQLTVSQILSDLNDGLTREDIQEKYSLTKRDMTALFQHPKLKGRKTKPALKFILEDDTEAKESISEKIDEVAQDVAWQSEAPAEIISENVEEAIAETTENTNFEVPQFNN